jgi:hypothetical protein
MYMHHCEANWMSDIVNLITTLNQWYILLAAYIRKSAHTAQHFTFGGLPYGVLNVSLSGMYHACHLNAERSIMLWKGRNVMQRQHISVA